MERECADIERETALLHVLNLWNRRSITNAAKYVVRIFASIRPTLIPEMSHKDTPSSSSSSSH